MHSESCYDENGELACQLEEHEHGEECYEQNLICDLAEQAGHEHTDACYELICGYENTDTPTAPAEEKDNAAEKLDPGD